MDGERALPRLEGDSLRNGPARQRAVTLEPEVIVEPPGVVTLDDEDRLVAALPGAERLRRDLRIALLAVIAEGRHAC
jgi:hypothetical protein